MKANAVRLWVLCFFLLVVVLLERNYQPSYPVLLPAMGILTAGIAVYGAWAVWCIWKPKLDSLRSNR